MAPSEPKSKPIYNLTFEDVWLATQTMGQQIINSDMRPSLIVPIYSGGLIPGAMLARYLSKEGHKHVQCWEMVAMFAKSYEGQDQTGRHSQHIPKAIYEVAANGWDILIVDDIYDTGRTMKAATYALQAYKPLIYTAALYTKEAEGTNYYGELLTNHDEWLAFPWE